PTLLFRPLTMRDGQRRIAQTNDDFNVAPRLQQPGIDRCAARAGQSQMRNVRDRDRLRRRNRTSEEDEEKGDNVKFAHTKPPEPGMWFDCPQKISSSLAAVTDWTCKRFGGSCQILE